MFGYKTFQALKARLLCDQAEMTSEQRHAAGDSPYKIQVSEQGRQSLGDMLSETRDEYRERNERQRDRKLRLLQQFSETSPKALTCDREPYNIQGQRLLGYGDDSRCWYVIWVHVFDEMFVMCTVMTRDTWAIQRTVVDRQYTGEDPPAEADTMLVDSPILTLEDIHHAVRRWLTEMCPTLSTVPLAFYPDDAMGSMSMMALTKRAIAQRKC